MKFGIPGFEYSRNKKAINVSNVKPLDWPLCVYKIQTRNYTLTPTVLLSTFDVSTGLATELFTLIANNQIVNQIRKHCITVQYVVFTVH